MAPRKAAAESKTHHTFKKEFAATKVAPGKKPRTTTVAIATTEQAERVTVRRSSKTSRKRSGFHLSQQSILDCEHDKGEDLNLHQCSFPSTSHANHTWGILGDQPISAPKRRRRAIAFKKLDTGTLDLSDLPEFDALGGLLRKPTPHSIDNSPLLRLSMEIREHIYKYLFRFPRPVLVGPDWSTVLDAPSSCKALLLVCKRLSYEALTFIYQNNTFHAILRPARDFFTYVLPSAIDSTYLGLYRTVIMEIPKDNWDLDSFEKATQSVRRLVAADTVLQSFTLVVSPQRVGVGSTALGVERRPITFADFLCLDGDFMKAVMSLICKRFRVMVRRKGLSRFMMEANLWALHRARIDDNMKGDGVSMKQRMKKAEDTLGVLSGMKCSLENAYMDSVRMSAATQARANRLADAIDCKDGHKARDISEHVCGDGITARP